MPHMCRWQREFICEKHEASRKGAKTQRDDYVGLENLSYVGRRVMKASTDNHRQHPSHPSHPSSTSYRSYPPIESMLRRGSPVT